jgi:hypothetical protein
MVVDADKSQAVAYVVEYLDAADGYQRASIYATVEAARSGIALIEAAGGRVTGKRVEHGAKAAAALDLTLIHFDPKETL